jgi:hypothetical protein
MSTKNRNDDYSPEEAQRRFEAAIKSALNTPPKPRKDMPRKRKSPPKRKDQGPARVR